MLKEKFRNMGIAAKLNLAIVAAVLLLMLGMTVAVNSAVRSALIEQGDAFVNTMKEQQKNEENLLRQDLVLKGKSFAEMLAKVGQDLLLNYEYAFWRRSSRARPVIRMSPLSCFLTRTARLSPPQVSSPRPFLLRIS